MNYQCSLFGEIKLFVILFQFFLQMDTRGCINSNLFSKPHLDGVVSSWAFFHRHLATCRRWLNQIHHLKGIVVDHLIWHHVATIYTRWIIRESLWISMMMTAITIRQLGSELYNWFSNSSISIMMYSGRSWYKKEVDPKEMQKVMSASKIFYG